MTATEARQSETGAITQKITTFLMFEKNSVEAAKFYVAIFKNSRMISPIDLPEGEGSGATFELDGTIFQAFDGGPHFSFTEGISLMVKAETQEEIDYYWEKLTAGGGEESMCGWLKDKYGVSWQITPPILLKLIGDPDRDKAQRVVDAMMKMKKIDIQQLQDAAAQ